MDGEKHAALITSLPDTELIARLQAGDETTFSQLVEHYNGSMVRIAAIYVNEFAVAEEVVQDTWIAILKGLDRFEGRSSFKTWIFTILSNRAKTRATRESRYVPLELSDEPDDADSAMPRFYPPNSPYAGVWEDGYIPRKWENIPETQLLGQE